MKIRWTATSVRLRITPTELYRLACGEAVEERLGSAPRGWRATIVPDPAMTDLIFCGCEVRLCLSAADRDRLLSAETEGVYFQTNDSPPLRYFIEKDFPCAHPRAADALEPVTETFAMPAGFAVAKLVR